MSEARGSVVAVLAAYLLAVALVGPTTAVSPVETGTAAVGADAAGPPYTESATGHRQEPLLQSQVDPDAVVMRATVRTDGTADWAVEYRVRLDDENATAAFESVQDDVAANASASTDRFATGMRRTVASAENATGREMALRNVTVTASKQRLGQEYGVLTYRFTWEGFAAVDDDRILVGDALAGLFLDSETALVVVPPGDHRVDEVRPPPTENRNTTVVWRGPMDFGPGEPRVVYAPAGSGGTGITPHLAGAAVLVVALFAGGWLLRTRRDGATDGESAGVSEAPRDASDVGAVATAVGETDDDDATGGGAGADDGSSPELLSNEERVLRLLDREGGRIKQQRIAAEFDWTDAKTSQVVTSLREDDAVETFRIGRENVVTLPEESDL